MTNYWGVAEAEGLARDLVEPLGRRWAHVQGVARQARRLAGALVEADEAEIVVAAAWLHDIGYAKPLSHTGFHPLDGARHIQELGVFPPVIADLVAHHTGALVEAEERNLLEPLAAEFQQPPRHLLDVVTAADLITGPEGLRVAPQARVNEILKRYPEDAPVHRAAKRWGPELAARTDALLARLADERRGSVAI